MRKPFALLPMAGLDPLAGNRSRPGEKRLRLPTSSWFAAAYCQVPGNWVLVMANALAFIGGGLLTGIGKGRVDRNRSTGRRANGRQTRIQLGRRRPLAASV